MKPKRFSIGSSNDPINEPVNEPVNLTERQKLILQMFSEDNSLSRERLSEKTNLSDYSLKKPSTKHSTAF